MNSLTKLIQKILTGFFALVLSFVLLYTPQDYAKLSLTSTHHANAQTIVNDPPATIINQILTTIGNAWSAVTAKIETSLGLKEGVLDGVAWAVAKAILQQMTASIVDWINSGFKGSPSFIQNLNSTLIDVADQAAGTYLNSLYPHLCAPFRIDILFALNVDYKRDRNNQPFTCSITEIGEGFDSYLDGSFINGGAWDTWAKVTMNPGAYTAYGAYLEASNELDALIRDKTGKELAELGWGDGFKSFKTCKASSTAANGRVQEDDCSINTPGAYIEDTLSRNTDSGRESLVAADEIDEIVGALFAQIASKAITGTNGLLGLSGGSGGGGGGGGRIVGVPPDTDRQDEEFLRLLQDARALESEYATLAQSYQGPVTAVANNPLSEATIRDMAFEEVTHIADILILTASNITLLEGLISDFETLMRSDLDTTAARLDMMQRFSSIRSLHSEADIEGSSITWEFIITPPPIDDGGSLD